MYDDLLRIKAFREKNAANEVTRRRRAVEERTQALQQARDRVEEFRAYRIAQEQQLFDDIKGQIVAVREIEDMKLSVAALRQEEADLENEILAAEKQLQDAREALAAARKQHSEKVREYEKFTQFIDIQREAERFEQVRREENELEETASAAQHGKQMIE